MHQTAIIMGYGIKMKNIIQHNHPFRKIVIMPVIAVNHLLCNYLRQQGGLLIAPVSIIAVILFSFTGCADRGKTPDSQNGSTRGLASAGDSTTENAQDTSWMDAFDNGQPGSSADLAASQDGLPWTIVLATFGSDNHQQLAERFRTNLIQVSGMAGFLITSRSDRSIIHFGHYATPNDPRAQADLERIHDITVDGRQPFARAFPSIVKPSDQGRYPQFNLVQLWKQYPHASVIYSLQIGFYSFDNAKSKNEARQAAEKAVTQLRAAGEQAFYYHSRTMSIITIGIFFQDSVDSVTGYSPEVLQLQKKYPYNLADGKQLIEIERLPGGKTRRNIQTSFLINVPKQ